MRSLTPRQKMISSLVSLGLADKEIAARLCISEGCVGNHLRAMFAKLGIHSRVQLAVWYAREFPDSGKI